ncbi:hypothetical protein [Cognatiluteimonas profundi]|uniref:hypothetical protein n=1 Tax=Cognatiluteimonas profundi TaxID=2594501 RepID=UPI00131A7EAD|nr:hypothetical protein [Lysobacter profundi]
MRLLKTWFPLLLALLLSACATAGRMDRNQALQQAQYAYSAAIRWGDFEGAWNMVEPAFRSAHPMTDLDFERYKQLQVSGYTELGAQGTTDTAEREIQIGVINRNTLVEHQVRYTELWRYEPVAKTWWLTVGLPNLSQAQ